MEGLRYKIIIFSKYIVQRITKHAVLSTGTETGVHTKLVNYVTVNWRYSKVRGGFSRHSIHRKSEQLQVRPH